ncbi:MAG: hypothetical protein QOE82_2777, partial [Thermoanaerobaculia bacterium]|nr:hypothetical protein [Thermoanaerobaculia bacterium]
FAFGRVLGTVVDKSPPDTLPADCGVLLYKTETIGDPQILITPFEGGVPTLVTLRNARRDQQGDHPHIGVIFMNLPLGERDDNEADFMLHYLAANKIPESPAVILPPGCPSSPFDYGLFRRMPKPHIFDLSTGCSASNLP